jgi:hypothetical protein
MASSSYISFHLLYHAYATPGEAGADTTLMCICLLRALAGGGGERAGKFPDGMEERGRHDPGPKLVISSSESNVLGESG